jgi:hypothetical protein
MVGKTERNNCDAVYTSRTLQFIQQVLQSIRSATDPLDLCVLRRLAYVTYFGGRVHVHIMSFWALMEWKS